MYAELIRNDKKCRIKSLHDNNLEVNFSAMTNNVEKMKKKMLTLISQIDARMKSRFMRETYLPTINLISSSKSSDQSFLDSYIDTKKKNESTTTLIVDEPQWVVDTRKDSKEHFWVAVGNKFLANELLPRYAPKALIDEYRCKGYRLLEVPIGYYENFQDNIDGALTDIAGIATASSLKYISGSRWNETRITTYENPFTREVIEVGTAKDDFTQYSDFFDLSKVDPILKSRPLYIHLDMSVKGDRTGIGGVWITGKKPKIPGEDSSRELFFQVAFGVSVKAPKGYEISFDKNRNFLRWLRDQGFSIRGVSCDTFQSSQIQQQLIADGFDVKVVSVDRIDSQSHQQLQYAYFKSTIYERRLNVFQVGSDLLTEEVLGLERLSDGHIEHPDAGKSGCFTGDTKVSLVDGRELSFLDLVEEFNSGKENFVYSFNHETKQIEAKRIQNAWRTKKNAKLVKVTLDNGEVLRCTPDHRFMMRDGSYVEAQDLAANDSLMPLYRKYLSKEETPMYEYRLYYEPIEDKWHYEHRRFVIEEYDGSHQIVHHKNCNKDNNNPTNLLYCSKATHAEIHSALSTGAWSPEAAAKRSKSLREWHANAKGTDSYKERSRKLSEAVISKQPEGYHEEVLARREAVKLHGIQMRAQSELNRQRIVDYHISIENMFNVKWDELTVNERNSYAVRYQRATHPETQEAISSAVSKNHADGKYVNSDRALRQYNEENKKLKELIPTVDPEQFFDIFGFRYEEMPSRQRPPYAVKYRRIVGKTILNHKVISVEFIDDIEDVYDITVEGNHNFALSAGVFVHNSKDISDSICGALWNASQHADEFAFEYGELLSAGIEASSNNYSMYADKKQIEIDMEDILNDLHDPLKDYSKKQAENDGVNFMNFGMGKAQPINYTAPFYFNQGIIL